MRVYHSIFFSGGNAGSRYAPRSSQILINSASGSHQRLPSRSICRCSPPYTVRSCVKLHGIFGFSAGALTYMRALFFKSAFGFQNSSCISFITAFKSIALLLTKCTDCQYRHSFSVCFQNATRCDLHLFSFVRYDHMSPKKFFKFTFPVKWSIMRSSLRNGDSNMSIFSRNKPLFGATIQPSCEYCVFSRPSQDSGMFYCQKKGIVENTFHCRSFSYDPLRRIPKRRPPMPSFTADDFKL